MTEELKQRLVDAKILIGIRTTFHWNELTILYALYNEISPVKMQVTTCGACLNTVITKIKKTCRENGL